MSESILKKVEEVDDALDLEWVELINDAIRMGLTTEDIRTYFLKNKS